MEALPCPTVNPPEVLIVGGAGSDQLVPAVVAPQRKTPRPTL